MNLKYVVIGVVAMLLAISELAQPGGAIDSVAQADDEAQAARPQPAAATAPEAEDEDGSADFAVADDRPVDEDPWFEAAAAPSVDEPSPEPSALDSERGTVPIEKQGLELPSPTGVMPSRWGF